MGGANSVILGYIFHRGYAIPWCPNTFDSNRCAGIMCNVFLDDYIIALAHKRCVEYGCAFSMCLHQLQTYSYTLFFNCLLTHSERIVMGEYWWPSTIGWRDIYNGSGDIVCCCKRAFGSSCYHRNPSPCIILQNVYFIACITVVSRTLLQVKNTL